MALLAGQLRLSNQVALDELGRSLMAGVKDLVPTHLSLMVRRRRGCTVFLASRAGAPGRALSCSIWCAAGPVPTRFHQSQQECRPSAHAPRRCPRLVHMPPHPKPRPSRPTNAHIATCVGHARRAHRSAALPLRATRRAGRRFHGKIAGWDDRDHPRGGWCGRAGRVALLQHAVKSLSAARLGLPWQVELPLQTTRGAGKLRAACYSTTALFRTSPRAQTSRRLYLLPSLQPCDPTPHCVQADRINEALRKLGHPGLSAKQGAAAPAANQDEQQPGLAQDSVANRAP